MGYFSAEHWRTFVGISNISDFRNKNKSILIDYPKVEKKLEALESAADDLLKIIQDAIGETNISSDEILYKDDFIALFQELSLLNALDDSYLTVIKNEFDLFLKGIEKSDTDKETFKAFPGCYEKKEKSEDPYGDYIIYHELVKYAIENETDIIFLTYDVTKGDWMQRNKSPHLHYVENFYQLTGKMLHILDGQRTFDDLLDINFKSLITLWSPNDLKVTINTISELIDGYPAFSELVPGKVDYKIVKELSSNGYNTISDIVNVLDQAVPYLSEISQSFPKFNRVGTLRACLHIIDPAYKQYYDGGWKRPNWEELNELTNRIQLN